VALAAGFACTASKKGAEHRPPACTKCVDAEGPDVVDLGLDRRRVYRPLRHG